MKSLISMTLVLALSSTPALADDEEEYIAATNANRHEYCNKMAEMMSDEVKGPIESQDPELRWRLLQRFENGTSSEETKNYALYALRLEVKTAQDAKESVFDACLRRQVNLFLAKKIKIIPKLRAGPALAKKYIAETKAERSWYCNLIAKTLSEIYWQEKELTLPLEGFLGLIKEFGGPKDAQMYAIAAHKPGVKNLQDATNSISKVCVDLQVHLLP